MRPAGRGTHDSLYFDYPQFAYRAPPEASGDSPRHAVVIVGAGPVGLTAAIELGRRGVPCIVLDDKLTVNDGSRAICISRSSFETLQQLGVVERFEQKALGWTRGRTYYRDRLVYRLEMPHSDNERFLPMYNLEQQYIEQFLIERAEQCDGLVDLRWGSRVAGVEVSDGEVCLTVETADGRYRLRSAWLIAADGARSAVRSALGLRLNGENLPGHYVIADVLMTHDFPTERRAFFASSANPEATVLVHRQPDNVWRIDWQIQADDGPQQAVEERRIRERLGDILHMIGHHGPWELEWWSIYTANTLCLDDYRHGRVLFAGDAAHIVPIFGVRGLNNGLADAVNVAWKLAYVVQGRAPTALLDSYSPERRGATLDVFRHAGRSSRFMTPPTRGFRLLRDAALQLALSAPFAERFADPRQVLPYRYADSALTSSDADDWPENAGISAGEMALNRRLADGSYLFDHLGPGFTVFYFVSSAAALARASELRSALSAVAPDLRLLMITPGQQCSQYEDRLPDQDNQAFVGYGAVDGSAYLVRPDRYIAGRWLCADSKSLTLALERALGGTSR